MVVGSFWDAVDFYWRHPHSIPGIRAFFCKMGRHDYEAVSADATSAMLECFYCLHSKKSHFRKSS